MFKSIIFIIGQLYFILGPSMQLGLLVFLFKNQDHFWNSIIGIFPGHLELGFSKSVELGFSSLYKQDIVLPWKG